MDNSKFKGINETIPPFAAIFDMDGVIADTIPYHSKAWMEFGRRHGVRVTKRMILDYFNGRVNKEILEFLFKKKLSNKETKSFAWEKETLYRKIYHKKAKPIRGLVTFLTLLKRSGIKVALATAGPTENVNVVLDGTKTRAYFDAIVDAPQVKLGKPHPEIFLKAARKLRIQPRQCIVFEDALGGVEAARRAKMKVIGVATSHRPAELKHADIVIKDYSWLTVEKLGELFKLHPRQ